MVWTHTLTVTAVGIRMRFMKQVARLICACPLLAALICTTGCGTLKRAAINSAGDALSGDSTTFSSDNDPELIREALPFSLKLMESLLAQTPDHPGLLVSLGSGFTQYAGGFIKQDADRLAIDDYTESERQYKRVRKLSLRGRDYMLRALDTREHGLEKALRQQHFDGLAKLTRKDVPLLYWTAAAWGSAISVSKNDPDLIAEIPIVEALIDRAFELQPDYNNGELHGFLITYETIRSGLSDQERSRRIKHHFDKAIELSDASQAAPYIAYAEAVSIQTQDYKEFKSLLNSALSIDVNTHPETRLVNIIMQERARWLLATADEFFLLTTAE